MAQTAQEFRTRLAIAADKLQDQRLVKSSHVFSTQLCSPVCACVSLWQELKWKKNQKRLKKQEKKAAEAAKKRRESKRPERQGFCFQRKGRSFKKKGGGSAHVFSIGFCKSVHYDSKGCCSNRGGGFAHMFFQGQGCAGQGCSSKEREWQGQEAQSQRIQPQRLKKQLVAHNSTQRHTIAQLAQQQQHRSMTITGSWLRHVLQHIAHTHSTPLGKKRCCSTASCG